MTTEEPRGPRQELEVTIGAEFPDDLFSEVQRIATKQNWTLPQAFILLVRLGVASQQEPDAMLAETHKPGLPFSAYERLESGYVTSTIKLSDRLRSVSEA